MPGYAKPPSYFARNISLTPAGNIEATNVQDAAEELDNDLIGGLASKIDYPTGGSDGDALLKSGTDAIWGASGALQLTNATSIGTGVSSISVNSVFSADYNVYRIVVNYSLSTDTPLSMRLRASGTDNSTGSSYISQGVRGIATSASAFTTTASYFTIGQTDSNTGLLCYDIFAPFLAQPTNLIGSFWGRSDYVANVGHRHSQSVSYDGFTLYPSSGTLSGGTIRVYGYIQ